MKSIFRVMIKIIRHFLHLDSLIYGIKNLYHWFPLIWQDRQWDQSYLFEILRLKLSLMEKYFDSDFLLPTDNKKQAKRMRICRLLIERILIDDYTSPFDELNENVENFEETKLGRKRFKWECEHKENMIKQDLNLLFKLLNKHIRYWWD